MHSLLSGNLMDVCPVGAITTRDYRFKSRPWDNPEAVDTICTLCEKGCNTTAWLKAKPEWAKGARLVAHDAALQSRGQRLLDVRHRPLRLSLDRGRRPARAAAGACRRAAAQAPATWSEALATLAERVVAAGGPSALRFLISAHASLEELFRPRPARRRVRPAGRRRGDQLADERQVAAAERRSSRCRRSTRRTCAGRADLGFPVSASTTGEADLSAFRADVEAGRVPALYVFDPGPGRIDRRRLLGDRGAESRASSRCSSSRACC